LSYLVKCGYKYAAAFCSLASSKNVQKVLRGAALTGIESSLVFYAEAPPETKITRESTSFTKAGLTFKIIKNEN
jgi:hypothetical protein